MPEKLFYELSKEKRIKVTSAVLDEFSQYSYYESSTNRIVKKAGIAKGSLFKYFSNKKDLYFFIIDSCIEDMVESLQSRLTGLPEDLFDRVLKYSELEFSWYIQQPVKYRLIKRAFKPDNTEIFRITEERYSSAGEDIYYRIFEDIGEKQLRWGKKKSVNILKWFLISFNEEFIREAETVEDIQKLKEQYLKQLAEYLKILKEGII